MTTEMRTAHEARKFMEQGGFPVESVKGERDPWSGAKFFSVTLRRNGHRLWGRGGAGEPWVHFSDDPATAEMYNKAETARRGTNIIIV